MKVSVSTLILLKGYHGFESVYVQLTWYESTQQELPQRYQQAVYSHFAVMYCVYWPLVGVVLGRPSGENI